MYCAACRQERLGTAKRCAACDGLLVERPRSEVEADLQHVRFLLAESSDWEKVNVPAPALAWITGRYRHRERVLVAALAGETELRHVEPIIDALPVAAVPVSVPAASPEAQVWVAPETVATVEPIAESPLEPAFDAPRAPSPEQRVIEEVSTWRTVWKPFLYESIGWFVGGFLILAGTLFFVAESWEGMTTALRSMVVFGLTAGYSIGFSAWGRFFLRRPSLAGAGRVLGVIGSAAAPLPALALQPLSEGQPLLFWALLAGWSAVAAWLCGTAASAYAPATRRPIQLAMAGTALMMGAAKLLAPLAGTQLVWSGLLAVVWLYATLASDAKEGGEESSERRAFTLLAPAYLGLLFIIRLHLALAGSGAPVPVASYAPVAAAVVLVMLRSRRMDPSRAADPLSIGAAALQAAFTAASVAAPLPGFFLTAALATATFFHLGRGSGFHARWHYGTYAAGYLAYQSVGSVIPGFIKQLFQQIKAALGYADRPFVPPNFAAVYAVPYVVALALVAARLIRSRAVDPVAREGQARTGEVLLRASAGGAIFFIVEALFGLDLRPGLWAVPPIAVTCLALGLWLDRRWLSWIGSLALVTVPYSVGMLHGVGPAAAVAGALSLGLAALSFRLRREKSHGRTAAAVVLAAGAAVLSLVPQISSLGALGAALGCAGMVVLSAAKPEGWRWALTAILGAVAASVAALAFAPQVGPETLAVVAVVLAATSFRRPLDPWGAVACVASVVACAWKLYLLDEGGAALPFLAPQLLAGALACALAARTTGGASPVLGALFLGAALVPVPEISPLHDLPRVGSIGLYAALGLAASLWTAWKGRSAGAIAHGVVALVGAAVLAGVTAADRFQDATVALGVAAAGALFAARAVAPRFCVLWAALLASTSFALRGDASVLWVAVAFTALALIEERPAWRALLFGPRSVATAASVGAVVALATARALATSRLTLEPMPVAGVTVALLVVCALAWARSSGRTIFLAVPALLLALWPKDPVWSLAALVAIPAWSLLVMRATSMSSRALRWMVPGASLERVELWVLGALFASIVIRVLAGDEHAWPHAAAGALVLLVAGGAAAPWRLVGALLLALVVPGTRQVGAVLAIGASLLRHHRPPLAGLLMDGQRASERDDALTKLYAGAGVGLAAADWAVRALAEETVFAEGLPLLAFTLAAFALLSGWRWVLAPAALAGGLALTAAGLQPSMALAVGGVVAAGAAAALMSAKEPALVHRWAARLGPGIPGDWSLPLWCAGAVQVALVLVLAMAGEPVPLLILPAAVLLLITAHPQAAAAGSVLVAGSALALAPAGWGPAAVALAGLALAAGGRALQSRLPTATVVHHAGWILAVLSLVGLRSLGAEVTPVTAALALAAGWTALAGRPALEPLGWAATLAWLHLGLAYLGIEFSTGKPETYLLPYVGAASALTAAVAFWMKPLNGRRGVAAVATALALLEIGAGLASIDTRAPTEALVAGGALLVLAGVGVVTARREKDEAPAFAAQLALAMGYLVTRLHGMGADLGSGDALAALVSGAVFAGLYGWAARQPEQVFRRPALLGAVAFPLAGLLAAPWSEPLVCAVLLVGHAAHFAVLARSESVKAMASLLAAVAFNLALLLTWQGSGAGEPQYYLIPAALSVLVLVRVFQDELSDDARARLRALALTAIYAAAAWKPLVFDETWAMLLCALICVIGVGVGIATRIRSYVYLGSAFLVVTVATNLVRYGLRDHRLGAVFLSALGLMVVGFMVLLSAQRAELLRRYERVRQLLSSWE